MFRPCQFIVEKAHTLIRPLAEVEKEAILQAMILCQGNQTLAARQLKVSRMTIERKLAQYNATETPDAF